MSKPILIIASNNAHKTSEIKSLLQPINLRILSQSEVKYLQDINVMETGETFLENAILKAQTIGRLTNQLVLADDSGLSIPILNDYPGVYSHRIAKTDNDRINLILQKLKHTQGPARQAYFTCVLALYNPANDKTKTFIGRTYGLILDKPHGSKGFGYDPIFYSQELQQSFGEVDRKLKNSVSHRAKAIALLKPFLEKIIH